MGASTKVFSDGTASWDAALAKAQKYLRDPDSITEIEKEWNWEDVDGYDFSPR